MVHSDSNGEVYGSRALTLALIAVSAFVLAGTVYSTSLPRDQVNPAHTQQIVDTTNTMADGVSG